MFIIISAVPITSTQNVPVQKRHATALPAASNGIAPIIIGIGVHQSSVVN